MDDDFKKVLGIAKWTILAVLASFLMYVSFFKSY